MNININEEKLDEYIIDAKDASFFTGNYFWTIQVLRTQ